jgi:hypothetical protein
MTITFIEKYYKWLSYDIFLQVRYAFRSVILGLASWNSFADVVALHFFIRMRTGLRNVFSEN